MLYTLPPLSRHALSQTTTDPKAFLPSQSHPTTPPKPPKPSTYSYTKPVAMFFIHYRPFSRTSCPCILVLSVYLLHATNLEIQKKTYKSCSPIPEEILSSSTGRRGLLNPGQTCFLVVLPCLTGFTLNPLLRIYFFKYPSASIHMSLSVVCKK